MSSGERVPSYVDGEGVKRHDDCGQPLMDCRCVCAWCQAPVSECPCPDGPYRFVPAYPIKEG